MLIFKNNAIILFQYLKSEIAKTITKTWVSILNQYNIWEQR